jgi:hypothetical protein
MLGAPARGTPEEAVRSAFVRHLLEDLEVPRSCLRTELGLSAWDRKVRDRVDVAVFDASGGDAVPILLAECKAPEVELDGSVVAQVRRYLRILPARWVAVTNGRATFSWICLDGGWQERRLPRWQEMKARPEGA